MQQVFMTRDEAAKLLRVTPRTVSTLVHQGKIPSTKVGRRMLIPVDAINRIRAKALAGGAA